MTRVEWNGEAPAARNARLRLPGIAREYFEEGRRVAAAAPSPKTLHAFRLHTKRLRYTLELFREVYGESLEEYLGGLRKVQTYLGDINDCATTLELVLDAMPLPSPLRRKIEQFLSVRSGQLTADFLDYWRNGCDAAGQEGQWARFLAGRVARTRPAQALSVAE